MLQVLLAAPQLDVPPLASMEVTLHRLLTLKREQIAWLAFVAYREASFS
jgi:hypothetical protein